MTNYLYFQSMVQYRVPIKEDGSLGHPEILKKFTSPIKGSQENYTRKNDKKVIKQTHEKKQQELRDLFKMKVEHE